MPSPLPGQSRAVLHIRAGGPKVLGAEKVILQLSSLLPRFGYRSIILAALDPRDESSGLASRAKELGLPTHVVETDRRIDLRLAQSIREIVRREDVAVVHSHGYKENLHVLLARIHTPRVATNHLWKRTNTILRFYALLDSAVIGRFTSIVGVSSAICDEMRRYPYIDAKSVSLIPNGIGTVGFETSGKRQESGEGPVRLITVSSLTPEKGIRYLIAALGTSPLRDQQWSLNVLGEGPERAVLEGQVRRLGLGDRIHFRGHESHAIRRLIEANVFVLPSLAEGLPMALLEAMAAGNAIVASRVGEVPTVLQKGRCGLLVDPGKANDLAESLLSLILDPGRIRSLGSAAAAWVREAYSAESMTLQYAELYDSLLSSQGGPHGEAP